ncbi:penicillin amidase [Sediminihabitans luteus]|uniref:Penicillin amidase n=1 Tax=Sediminihabitans luteus TaxID=1138585 RepID=A0A2M9CQW0_9CELL|nr:penicillin acylase family protein [Sediminihabitans luteus]PJJ74279.1 penicillin amidase [Sediminihabitans luteus]GII99132.1 hypothetical protein Slu03_15100 [Sediminihabitans luteus]
MTHRWRTWRDAHGVPHLRAPDELTLAEAQGYVTARDRGWQIEVDRWRSEARLAAHLGETALDWDVLATHLRLDETARRVYAALADPERTWVEAYARGVNAGLADGGRDTPEHRTLETLPGPTPDPAPWQPWTPIGVLLVAHVLFNDFPHQLWRDHVVRTLAPHHPDVPATALADLFAADGGPGPGSNAWALAGARTATGHPLLAGDPHRVLELPGTYQQVRLACDAYDVLGLALPGVPGVAHFAHAGSVAWGITNAVAHQVTVTHEHLREHTDGTREAHGPHGWEPAPTETVHLTVRTVDGVRTHPVRRSTTPRGVVLPVTPVPDPTETEPVAAEQHAYALDLPGHRTHDLGIASMRTLLYATTAHDVATALAGWVEPVNRVLVADDTGAVLRLTAGFVPDVPPAHGHLPQAPDGDPVPGRRVLPAPVVVTDVAVDANERPDVAYGHAYAAPHRARRVRALLDEVPGTPEGQQQVHADTFLASVAGLLALLPPADDPHLGAGARTVLRELRAWDARMDAGSRVAATYARWRSHLVRRVAGHSALAPLRAEHGLSPELAPWFDVTARVGDAIEHLTRGGTAAALGVDGRALARAALDDLVAEDARDDGTTTAGTTTAVMAAAGTESLATEPAGATWGESHTLVPVHAFLGVPGAQVPGLGDGRTGGTGTDDDLAGDDGAGDDGAGDDGAGGASRLSGDTDCVCSTVSTPGASDLCWRGPAARWVWDLGDRDASRWGVPFGAAGDARSPHFADQHAHWLAGRTVRVETRWERLVRDESCDGPPARRSPAPPQHADATAPKAPKGTNGPTTATIPTTATTATTPTTSAEDR